MSKRYVCEEYETPYEEGYRRICSIEEHDKQIRADEREKVIEEFYNRISRYKLNMNTANYPWNYVEIVYREMNGIV